MFAIVEVAGQQFKVAKGTKFESQKLDAAEGETVTVKTILLLADGKEVKIGDPYIMGPEVECKVLKQFKNEKVRVFKKKAKKRYTRNKGHRQNLTKLEVVDIKG